MVIDFFCLFLSIYLAYILRFDFDFTLSKAPPINIGFFLAAVVFKIVIFAIFKLYKSLWLYAGAYEVVNVVLGSGISNFVLSLLLIIQYHFTGALYAPRSIFAITFMIDVFAVGGLRLLYRVYRRIVRGVKINMSEVKRVLIFGAGNAGAAIAKEMIKRPKLCSKPVAFVETDPYKIGYKINGIKVLDENKYSIEEIVREEQIDEIIIAIPHAKATKINQIYSQASKTGCKVKILPSVSQMIDESVVMQKVRDIEIEDLLGRDPVNLDTSEIEKFITCKRVLVTGAGGSIGSELCRQLAVFKPQKLYLLDNYENSLHDLLLELREKHSDIEFNPVIANIREEKHINALFQKIKPNIIFHAAAHKHVPLMELHPEEAIKNNVFGTWNVSHAADKAGVERFVLISTDKAVNPANVMGATKRIAELIVQAINTKSKTEFVAVRFGNVLGSNGSVIPIFKHQIEEGGPVTVTHPEMTRFFMTIPEAAQLVIQAGASAKGGEIFILDMGQPVRILELAENMIRLSGFEPYEDIDIKFCGVRPGEKLYEELLLN
ncbi:MAG: polysaccharide biosynthesis protein, partial [Clostridiaceae bacterium]|nr:polysaccharide biosynthesis protein [Clostridiaceae bacterium]